ncbi:hypothetical protein VYU27_004224 [Nannochloropsis oceanica]
MMQPPPQLSKPSAAKAALPQQHHNALPDDETRFIIELEFVQCLANADYLHWLALNKYLDDPAFVVFLRYLNYWRRPEYARFLVYPQTLAVLELLGRAEVRKEIGRVQYKDFLQDQQLLQWRFYLNNRRRLADAGSPAGTEGERRALRALSKAGGTWSSALNEPPGPPLSVVDSGGGRAGVAASNAKRAEHQARI